MPKISEILICEKCGGQNIKGDRLCGSCGNPLNRDYYRGVWIKNTAITLALYLLPFLILFSVINRQVVVNLENQVKTGLDYSVDVNYRAIRSFFDERKRDLLSLAGSEMADLAEVPRHDYFYQTFLREKPWFDLIAVADLSGTIRYATRPIKGNIADREYFLHSSRGEYFISGIFRSEILDTAALIMSLPFYNRQRRLIGVILASISLKNFYELIVDLRQGRTSEVFLIDTLGVFLSPSRLGGTVLQEKAFYHRDENPYRGDRGLNRHRDYRGQLVLSAYRRSVQPPWYVVSEMDLKEALAPVTQLKNVMLQVLIVFSLYLIASSVFFSRQVLNSLKSITRNLKAAVDEISDKKNTINTINVELRKRLQECQTLGRELRNSESQVKDIINSISGGLLALDGHYRVTYFNEAMKEFCEGEPAIGGDALAILPFLNDPAVRPGLDAVIGQERPLSIPLLRRNLEDGTLCLRLSALPIKTPDKNRGAILFAEDITEQEFLRSQMEDYEKLSALSQLALGAAHEINNPLQGITAYLEIIMSEEKSVERKAQIKEVLDNAYRISETVRGLLNFARPSPPKFTKLSANRLVRETISFLRHQPLFKRLVIKQELAEDLPLVTADVNQIRQVLINILLNAAQAMPDRGTLTVATAGLDAEERIRITIRDTGVGIAPENLDRLFEPFFTTKKNTGTGLGLSISYSYIKNHHGEISIASAPGAGTTVAIVLPVRQSGVDHNEVIE